MVRPTRFEIGEERKGEVLILLVSGELDLASVPVLQQRVDGQLGEDLTAVTLDLSEVTFMDSSGLRLLIELHQRSAKEGWRLALVPSRHESARTVLHLTGADAALPFEKPAR